MTKNTIITGLGTLAETIWRGYVASVLWAWLIVPTFAVKPIGVASAVGVICVLRFVTVSTRDRGALGIKTEGDATAQISSREISAAITRSICGPLFTLAFAAAIRAFL